MNPGLAPGRVACHRNRLGANGQRIARLAAFQILGSDIDHIWTGDWRADRLSGFAALYPTYV